MRISDWSSDVCSSDLAKRRALEAAAAAIRARAGEIAGANAKDMAAARGKGLTDALLDRLALTPDRIEVMARGVEEVAALPHPVGRTLDEWERPNGLQIARLSVPPGVIRILYPSRPTVTRHPRPLRLQAGPDTTPRG